MINIIINNQIFIPKGNILYIDTEYVVRHTVAGASVKQCTIFLKGVDGGGCDGVSSIAPLQIPVAYEHIATLKQAVRDALTGISTNNCLKLNTEIEIVDSAPTKEYGNVIDEDFTGFTLVYCPRCSSEIQANTQHKDFPLIRCASCSKEFTYYQGIKPKPLKELEVVHAIKGDKPPKQTLCGLSLEQDNDLIWFYLYSFLDSSEHEGYKNCPQCYLIATQLS